MPCRSVSRQPQGSHAHEPLLRHNWRQLCFIKCTRTRILEGNRCDWPCGPFASFVPRPFGDSFAKFISIFYLVFKHNTNICFNLSAQSNSASNKVLRFSNRLPPHGTEVGP